MRKVKWILMVLAALFLVTAIAVASDLMPHPSNLIAFYARPAETDPAQVLAEPIVRTSGSTTVALVNAVASSSQTVVEFVVEDESFPEDLQEMQNISIGPGPMPEAGLHLSGFTEANVLNWRTTRSAGQIHLIWELPPPAVAGEPVIIEIEELPLNRVKPETEQMAFGSLSGPWRFEFTPQLSQEQQRTQQFTVNQRKMSGPVAITVEDVLLSATETVVSVHYEAPPDIGWQPFGTPILAYEGETFEGRQKQASEASDNEQVWSFPAVPPETTSFALAFNPLWLTVEDDVAITLDLDRLQSDEQVVDVGEYNLSFVLAPSPESAGFMLAYRPADATSSHFLLDAPGEQLKIEDNLGNSYTVTGGNFDFEPDKDFALEQHAFYTHEPLADDANELTLRLERTGRVTKPVQFEISVPSVSSR